MDSGVTAGDGGGSTSSLAAQNNIVDSPQDDGMGPPDGLGGPAPKRRRVTRACDECRRKKIKCDGKQVLSPKIASMTHNSRVRIVPFILTVCIPDCKY